MKKAAIAGFILLLLGGIFFGIYSLLPDHDYGGVTNVEINAAMYADLSEDGTKIAINDSYEKIYCIDKNTGRMEYLVDQLQGPWDYFEDVLFDQEENLYAYLLEMDEDGAVTIRESIVKYSSSGKELGRIVCYDKERDGERLQQTDECVFGIHIKDGYVYYTIYTNGRLNLMRGKIGGESECLSTCSFHDSRNLRWCVESGEGGYITCWSNSDVGHVSEDGIYTSLYQFHYRIDSQEVDNILPG